MDYHGRNAALPPEALERLRNRVRAVLQDVQPAAGATPAPANAPTAEPGSGAPAPASEAVEAAAATEAEQRRHAARHKTMLSGKLVFNEMSSVVDCFVRDLSDTGARIKLAAPLQLPPVFILRFNNGRYHRCQVRRRAGLELGVEFLD